LTPERWAQIRSVFEGAIEQPVGARQAYLEAACGFDLKLRAEVEKLMANETDEEFLAQPALHMVAAMSSSSTISRITSDPNEYPTGYAVGPYQLQKRIGKGGMGSVWLANRVDHEFDRIVAVKLVHRGRDTEEILRRFRLERQVLAGLEHPNIARLIDGGSTGEGLPFLAMEYVEGVRIDQYCQERKLTVRQRIALFRQVCSAVGYAHQNLVVHRDIKASNILVTADGTPKLLDFGIAKLLRTESSITETRPDMRPMTLDYASPEQVGGGTITTASDVYSMGVLLYKLLTGVFPYGDKNNMAELHEAIRRSPAIPPSHVDPSLDKEIDAIVLKSLRKDPAQRYSSAEHFSEDLARFLDGRAVLAMGDAVPYRLEKFLQRNWKAAVLASVIPAALIGGILVAVNFVRNANSERARVQQQYSEAQQSAIRQQTELSNTYFHLADLETAKGELQGALITNRAALNAAERFAKAYPDLPSGSLAVARAATRLGLAASAVNLNGEAQQALKTAADQYQLLTARAYPFETEDLRNQVIAGHSVGIAQYQGKDYVAALRTFTQALAVAEKVGDKTLLASTNFWIAETLTHNNAADASLGPFRKSFELWRDIVGSHDFAPVPAPAEYEAALTKLASIASGDAKTTLESDLAATTAR
jgi:serine/threonine protein kinase